MKERTKDYEFFYSVTTDATSKEADKIFSFDGICLKQALIKFAEHLASFSDFDIGRYQISSLYLVDDKYKELSPDDHLFCQYYIQYSLMYKR